MAGGQRIASLLPGATEMIVALGLGDRLVGVSHECNFPPKVRGLPRLTSSLINSAASSCEIDVQVSQMTLSGLSLYQVDDQRLVELGPDLIVTQDTCSVCAVTPADLQAGMEARLGHDTQVLSLTARTLADVMQNIGRLADAAQCNTAESVVRGIRRRIDVVRRNTASGNRPRVLFLEWLEPPMTAGHWTVELIEAAGGTPLHSVSGGPATRIDWDQAVSLDPDVIVAAPCGFTLNDTLRELPALIAGPLGPTRAARSGRVYAIDGDAYFNRPGPRLADSAELLAAALHPDLVDSPSTDVFRRMPTR